MSLHRRCSPLLFTVLIAAGVFLNSCNGIFGSGEGLDPDPVRNVLSAEDSLAVRAILDTNGLFATEVREVIQLESSILGGMTIDSVPITRFIFTDAFNTFVRGLSINIIDCPVDTIIIKDSIYINITIGIGRTNLRAIPAGISLFTGNMYLYLANNKIENISEEILKCDISFIYLPYNRICSVSDTLNTWIISKKPNKANWQSSQQCDSTPPTVSWNAVSVFGNDY